MPLPAGFDLVTDLPTSLACFILSNWVSAADLARLDSAYCCHEKRDVVLSMFESEEFVCKDEVVYESESGLAKQHWDWILLRDIKLFHVTADSSEVDDGDMLESYASRHEKHIRTLGCNTNKLEPFSRHCKHLIELTCDVSVTPEFRTLLQNNQSLQILTLRELAEVSAESFESIRLPDLTELTLEIRDCLPDIVKAVLAMPSRLLKLSLWEIDADLTGVAQSCPHLRSLDLFLYNKIWDDFNLAEFTSHLPHLANYN